MRRVTLGRVAGVYGVRGWIRIRSFTQPPDKLLDYPRWWIAQGQGFEATLVEGRAHGQGFEATLVEGRAHGGALVAQLGDETGRPIEDRDTALRLIGAQIQVARSALPPPPSGQVYLADLIGLAVRNEDGVDLGTIDALAHNGAQDVLVLKGEDGAQRLIPFVRGPIIKSVDLEQGLVVADWQPDY